MSDLRLEILLKSPIHIATHVYPRRPGRGFETSFRGVSGFVAGMLGFITRERMWQLQEMEWREDERVGRRMRPMQHTAYFAPFTADHLAVQSLRINLGEAWDAFLARQLLSSEITQEAFYAGAGRLVVPPTTFRPEDITSPST